MLKRFKKGDIIFREGSPSESVVRVQSGTVDVYRDVGDQAVKLGSIGPGEFLGEMGVIEGRPRIATAYAADDVEAEFMTPKRFFERMSSEPSTAYDLILRMSTRLRHVEDRLVDELNLGGGELASEPAAASSAENAGNDAPGDAGDDGAAEPDAGAPAGAALAVELQPETYALKWYVGTEPHRVVAFPFLVGRTLAPDEQEGGPAPDLEIDDPAPHRLARVHFSIVQDGATLHVRDLSTALGTIVNGVALGSELGRDRCPLRQGENEIVAGGASSPYRFKAVVS